MSHFATLCSFAARTWPETRSCHLLFILVHSSFISYFVLTAPNRSVLTGFSAKHSKTEQLDNCVYSTPFFYFKYLFELPSLSKKQILVEKKDAVQMDVLLSHSNVSGLKYRFSTNQ